MRHFQIVKRPECQRNAQEEPGVHLFPTVSVMMAIVIEESYYRVGRPRGWSEQIAPEFD